MKKYISTLFDSRPQLAEREQLIELPEYRPEPGRRDIGAFIAVGVGFVLIAMLLSELYPVVMTLPVLH